MKKIILTSLTSLFFALGAPSFAAEQSMQEKFSRAQAGDYIVTSQDGNYSVLCIRTITSDTLLLEEISVPEKLMTASKTDWKKWVAEKAPGHTSWTLYEIDRQLSTLIECFSYSKNGWLYLDQSEQLLTRLLFLPLIPVQESERKKIGQAPKSEEEDRRALWIPPLVIEGTKIQKPTFEVLKTTWPDDHSRLSLCGIELYFVKDFPFPFWMEIHSPHYNFKMRSVDAGHDLISPLSGPMPHRSPQILGAVQKGPGAWTLTLRSPPYYATFHLFVIDQTAESKATIPIAFTQKTTVKKEEWMLEIEKKELEKTLIDGHRYQWVVIPDGSSDIYVESEEGFTWHPSSTCEQTFPIPKVVH